jgi:hypothetical protein
MHLSIAVRLNSGVWLNCCKQSTQGPGHVKVGRPGLTACRCMFRTSGTRSTAAVMSTIRTAPAVRTAEVPNEADLAAVTADTVQGVRWRALVGRHSVRQQAFRGREVKPVPMPRAAARTASSQTRAWPASSSTAEAA